MAGSMVSGVILSRYALAFLPINASISFARKLHMVFAYWGFIFMSLHLGIHWAIITGITKKFMDKHSWHLKLILRIIVILVAGYGVYAFIKRNILSYMFMEIQFVFFDFEEPLLLFIFDYVAIMGLFVFSGYYISKGIKYINTH